MKKAGIIGLAATLAATIPLLFLMTRGSLSAGQFGLITAGVLLFVAWCGLYIIAIDPWLRRWVGGIFNVRIEVRGMGGAMNWEPVEKRGSLVGLFIPLIGYVSSVVAIAVRHRNHFCFLVSALSAHLGCFFRSGENPTRKLFGWFKVFFGAAVIGGGS